MQFPQVTEVEYILTSFEIIPQLYHFRTEFLVFCFWNCALETGSRSGIWISCRRAGTGRRQSNYYSAPLCNRVSPLLLLPYFVTGTLLLRCSFINLLLHVSISERTPRKFTSGILPPPKGWSQKSRASHVPMSRFH